jgi:DNA-binding transcriptional LysR family regulator
MDYFADLAWELSVLNRAVVYDNLTVAALHVGLSQPQLSRIVSKLEGHLKSPILDRSSRRKSGWTPFAQKIASLYAKSAQQIEIELQKASKNVTRQFRIGTLEGLSTFSMAFGKSLLDAIPVQQVSLHIYDLDELEGEFLKENLDFIFTIREPSRKKLRYIKSLGYQETRFVSKDTHCQVVSPFEHSSQKKRSASAKTLISNSLAIRKQWLERFGGQGFIPGDLQKRQIKAPAKEIFLIGSELLSTQDWEEALKINF